MSINAEIIGSEVLSDGTVGIALGPYNDDAPGQSCLIVENPPEDVTAFRRAILGTHIWGDSSSIMIGTTKWANRESYTRIRLESPAGANSGNADVQPAKESSTE